jgi:YHS domain-containing protein
MSNESQAPASCYSTSPAREASAEAPVSAGSSCCDTIGAERSAVKADGREDLLADGEDTTTCPVMGGNPVSKKVAEAQGLFRDYDGKRYWFCCAGCAPAHDSDPAKYAANMA